MLVNIIGISVYAELARNEFFPLVRGNAEIIFLTHTEPTRKYLNFEYLIRFRIFT
jgi:hypothetical protein